MKKYLFPFVFILAGVTVCLAQNDKYDVDAAKATSAEFKEEDPDIAGLFSSAYGYAVFPSIGKGGVGIGGAAGRGVVFKGGAPAGGSHMTQVSVGLQLGGQKYSEVIFFENATAYEKFVGEKFKFAAQASAVALASGASADATYADGVLIFTMPIGGLMYEASVGGQQFKFEAFE